MGQRIPICRSPTQLVEDLLRSAGGLGVLGTGGLQSPTEHRLPGVRPILCDHGLLVSSQGEKVREPSVQHPTPCPVIQPKAEVRAIHQAWTEARLNCKECRPESLPKCRGPLGWTTSTLPVHREAVAIVKDLRHQVSRQLHYSVDPLGEEGEIRVLYIPNPNTVLAERPACSLPVHKSYPSGIPLSGSSPEESAHTRSKPIPNGTWGLQDGKKKVGMMDRTALFRTKWLPAIA